MNEPSDEDLRNAPVLPGFELPEVFPLSRGALHTVGLQPEDHSVLAFLKMRDPRRPASKEDLAAEMQAIGWKMGKTRFDGIFGRLKAAGHIKHVSAYNAATGRPEWRIEFFANPSYNDHYVNSVISASSQVSSETLETGVPQREQLSETLETSISPGQKESQVSRDTEGKPRNPAFPSGLVPAGQSRNAENPVFGSHPPHPPEEVTTSPSPHSDTSDRASIPSQKEGEEAGYAEKDLTAASDVLQLLPAPWTQGRRNGDKLAPKLLDVMAEQNWPDIHTADRLLLTAQLTKNPKGVTNPYRLLASDRIPNLPRYEVVAAARESSGAGSSMEMCPEHPQYRAGSRCIPCRTA